MNYFKIIRTVLKYSWRLLKRKKKLAAGIWLLLDQEKDLGIANHNLVKAFVRYRKTALNLITEYGLPAYWNPRLLNDQWHVVLIDYGIDDVVVPMHVSANESVLSEMGSHPPADFAWTRMMNKEWKCSWLFAIPTAVAFIESRFNDEAVGGSGEKTSFQIMPNLIDTYKERYDLERRRDTLWKEEKQLSSSLLYGTYAISDHLDAAAKYYIVRSQEPDFLSAFGRLDKVSAFLICFRLSYQSGSRMIINSQTIGPARDFLTAMSFYNQLWCTKYAEIIKEVRDE